MKFSFIYHCFPRLCKLVSLALGDLTQPQKAQTIAEKRNYAGFCMAAFAIVPTCLAEVSYAQDQPSVRAGVAKALNLELESLEPLELPRASALQRVAKVTDWDVDRLRTAELFAADRKDEAPIRLARVPVGKDEAHAYAIIALQEEDMGFVRAAIVNEDNVIIEEWQHFMKGLKWHDVPRLDGAEPRSYLGKRLEDAEKQDDLESRLVVGLLRTMQHMQEQASLFNLPTDNRVLGSESEELFMVAREFGKLAQLAPALAPLLGKEGVKEFARLASDSSRAAQDLAKIVKSGGDADESKVGDRFMDNCLSCHEIKVLGSSDFLKGASAAKRQDLGIGNGFYVVGHDLRIRHPERERAQRIADALRRGALLIDAYRVISARN